MIESYITYDFESKSTIEIPESERMPEDDFWRPMSLLNIKIKISKYIIFIHKGNKYFAQVRDYARYIIVVDYIWNYSKTAQQFRFMMDEIEIISEHNEIPKEFLLKEYIILQYKSTDILLILRTENNVVTNIEWISDGSTWRHDIIQQLMSKQNPNIIAEYDEFPKEFLI